MPQYPSTTSSPSRNPSSKQAPPSPPPPPPPPTYQAQHQNQHRHNHNHPYYQQHHHQYDPRSSVSSSTSLLQNVPSQRPDLRQTPVVKKTHFYSGIRVPKSELQHNPHFHTFAARGGGKTGSGGKCKRTAKMGNAAGKVNGAIERAVPHNLGNYEHRARLIKNLSLLLRSNPAIWERMTAPGSGVPSLEWIEYPLNRGPSAITTDNIGNLPSRSAEEESIDTFNLAASPTLTATTNQPFFQQYGNNNNNNFPPTPSTTASHEGNNLSAQTSSLTPGVPAWIVGLVWLDENQKFIFKIQAVVDLTPMEADNNENCKPHKKSKKHGGNNTQQPLIEHSSSEFRKKACQALLDVTGSMLRRRLGDVPDFEDLDGSNPDIAHNNAAGSSMNSGGFANISSPPHQQQHHRQPSSGTSIIDDGGLPGYEEANTQHSQQQVRNVLTKR